MASTLTDRLSRLVKTMRGQARITESNVQDMLREVRMALLEADVALPVVRDFIARVKEKALGAEVVGSLSPGQALVGIVNRELAATMGEGVSDINLVALMGSSATVQAIDVGSRAMFESMNRAIDVGGMKPASMAAVKSSAVVESRVAGSCAVRPSTTPIVSMTTVSRRMWTRTVRGTAPSAMRIPISRVRRLTL